MPEEPLGTPAPGPAAGRGRWRISGPDPDGVDEDPIVHDTVALPRPAKLPASRKSPEPPEHSPLPTRAEQLALAGWPATTGCRRRTLLGNGDARRRPAAAPTTR